MASNNSLESESETVPKWGLWDVPDVWNSLFENLFLKDFVFPNLQSKYFDPLDKDFRNIQFNVISEFASIELKQSEDTTDYDPYIRTICEITCMASNRKEKDALPAEQAGKKFAKILTRYMATWAQNINPTDVDAEIAAVTKSSNTHACIFSDHTMTSPVKIADTDIFMLFMRVLCRLKKKDQNVPIIRSAFLTCIAIAKMGAASEKYLEKMRSIFFQETRIHLDISEKEVREIWRNIRRGIDDTNVQDIISMWENYLPPTALKTRQNFEILGNGLTSLIAIHKVLITHPHFEWDKLAAVFPDQESAVVKAFEAVNGNPYYGYKKDLGPVIRKRYKEYSYVAKEILVKIEGDFSLEKAACWVKTPAWQLLLDSLIAEYKRNHTLCNAGRFSTETVNNLTELARGIKSFY